MPSCGFNTGWLSFTSSICSLKKARWNNMCQVFGESLKHILFYVVTFSMVNASYLKIKMSNLSLL